MKLAAALGISLLTYLAAAPAAAEDWDNSHAIVVYADAEGHPRHATVKLPVVIPNAEGLVYLCRPDEPYILKCLLLKPDGSAKELTFDLRTKST